MKHAYLIMAHNHFEQLQLLVKLLDHPDNDFFIHIDQKLKLQNLKIKAKYSKVSLFQEVPIYWGTFSITECEIKLLAHASNAGKYDYYHLLSGQDLPIRPTEEILSFFEEHVGKEFISFNNEALNGNTEISRRTKLYHFFAKQRNSHESKFAKSLFLCLDRMTIVAQMVLRVNRNRKDNILIGYGSNWFSISDELASFVLSQENRIRKRFRYVNNCDELFLQTIILNSQYAFRCYGYPPHYDNLRFINWAEDGVKHPATMSIEDVKKARLSTALFARKFDIKENKKAILLLLKELGREDLLE